MLILKISVLIIIVLPLLVASVAGVFILIDNVMAAIRGLKNDNKDREDEDDE